ncbi:MAG: substrate-binding domain-containing protein [Rhodobacteraceae bacterium]|nr:substrate-binding domain-containing protein [Paracoccaceae bacterium]
MKHSKKHRGRNLLCTVALLGAAFVPTQSLADVVTLKSADGTVNLVGEFVDFVDETYIIKTSLGNLRISASRVRCEGTSCPVFETATADVVFNGSDTIGVGLMPLLMTGYSDVRDADAEVTNTSQSGQTITKLIGDQGFGDELGTYLVTSSGTDEAFQALLDKTAQVGMASRRITPQEARALRDSGAGNMVSPDQERVIAVDSIVVITHPSNPVTSLSINELGGIYTGRITNWSDVGGPDLPIKLHGYKDGFDTETVFYNRIFGEVEGVTPAPQVEAEDSNQMSILVNEDPGAIGFVSFAFQRGSKGLNIENECGIVTTPDEFSAKTEEYAIQRRLYFYNRGDNTEPATQEFLDYVTSASSDDVISKSGFISLGITRTTQDLKGNRARALMAPVTDPYQSSQMREMLGAMIDQDRLSTTFRYRTGSSKLDEKGLLDMKRLVGYLETLPAGSRVSFVGFTDDEGAFDANRRLSVARAEQVAADIKAMAPESLANIEISTSGFGEMSPAACNTTSAGKALNRRVEVWVQASNG